jgi:dolichol-phosphate mannosyltransferase
MKVHPRETRASWQNSDIKRVLLFVSYYDLQNLIPLLEDLVLHLQKTDCILILDDSGFEHYQMHSAKFQKISESSGIKIEFSLSEKKTGRGGAVYRGIEFALTSYKNLEFILEADSDGSHQSRDILRVLISPSSDVQVGSRYLGDSFIEGWPLSRRLMSALLNKVIPFSLGVKCTDITNGLRRYSRAAAKVLLDAGQSQSGFIYLSEQVMVCDRVGLKLAETPIHFVNRTSGESTVGLSEIFGSLKGLIVILMTRLKKS